MDENVEIALLVCFLLVLSTQLSRQKKTRQVPVKGKGETEVKCEGKTGWQCKQGEKVTGDRGCVSSPESCEEWHFTGGLMDEPAGRVGWGYGRSLACPLFRGCCCSSLKIQFCQCPCAVVSPSITEGSSVLSPKIQDNWRTCGGSKGYGVMDYTLQLYDFRLSLGISSRPSLSAVYIQYRY